MIIDDAYSFGTQPIQRQHIITLCPQPSIAPLPSPLHPLVTTPTSCHTQSTIYRPKPQKQRRAAGISWAGKLQQWRKEMADYRYISQRPPADALERVKRMLNLDGTFSHTYPRWVSTHASAFSYHSPGICPTCFFNGLAVITAVNQCAFDSSDLKFFSACLFFFSS